MDLDHACWNMQKEAFVTMWKENYQNTRIVNEHMVSDDQLCIDILMIYGIINLHHHMHFFRYLDGFYHPQWCFISINSVDTRTLLE